jgi:hypothetical protein
MKTPNTNPNLEPAAGPRKPVHTKKKSQNTECHSESSAESISLSKQTLRFAQGDLILDKVTWPVGRDAALLLVPCPLSSKMPPNSPQSLKLYERL